MMIQIDFAAVRDVGRRPKGLMLTLVINCLINPFPMVAGLAVFLGNLSQTRHSGISTAIYCRDEPAGGSILPRHEVCLEPTHTGRFQLNVGTSFSKPCGDGFHIYSD